jgi:hypothetical protein
MDFKTWFDEQEKGFIDNRHWSTYDLMILAHDAWEAALSAKAGIDAEAAASLRKKIDNLNYPEIEQLLCDVVQLLTGWHADLAWTDWDQSIKDKCVVLLRQFSDLVQQQSLLRSLSVPPADGKEQG